jgi:hypothetical protein
MATKVDQYVDDAQFCRDATRADAMVALLEIETVPENLACAPQRQAVANLLGLSLDDIPSLRLKWCHLSRDASGEIVGCCSKMPADLEAKIGVHVDNQHSDPKEEVFGYVHLKTTDLNPQLGLELPVGNSTYAADTKEGNEFIAHRSKLAVSVYPGQKHLGDSAYDLTENYKWLICWCRL